MQTCLQHEQRAGAEQQAAGAQGRIVDDDFVGCIESAELARELVEVGAKKMRAELRGRELKRSGEAD